MHMCKCADCKRKPTARVLEENFADGGVQVDLSLGGCLGCSVSCLMSYEFTSGVVEEITAKY